MLFILAEKHKQEQAYAKALRGKISHPNRYIDEVDNSKTLPKYPKIQLSYLQGHAYELVDAKDYNKKWASWALKYLPIFPKKFKHRMSKSFIKYSGGRSHMKAMRRAISNCNKLWLGSDPDFEGEGLIYEAVDINHWNNKVAGRIWVNHGLTVSGLVKTFHNIKNPEETKPRGTASHAREIADWLMGINDSRVATDIAHKYGYRGVFTAGRVQTPTLALIAQRRIQRTNFKPTTSYRLAFLDKNGLNFMGSTKDKNNKNQKVMFKTKDDANKVISNLRSAPTIIKVANQKCHQTAPKLPKTNDMQAYLVKHAHITGKQAANQVLEPMYDQYSAQTYPRTECNLITIDDFNAIKHKLPQYIRLYSKIIGKKLSKSLFTNLKPRRKYVDFTGKKVQKQGHGAITVNPENKVMSYAQYQKLNFQDKVDYKHVLARTLAMFADDHAYQRLQIEAKIGKYIFSASNRVDLQNNTDWQQLFPGMNKKKSGHKISVDDYKRGNQLNPTKKYSAHKGYYPKPETTSAPTAITESNLLGTIMPKYNLGTSATRSGIIDSLKHTKLIVSAKKKDKTKSLVKGEFMPTPKGIICLQLMQYSHLLDLAKVSYWENQMKSIAAKKLSYSEFIKGIKHDISVDVARMPKHKYHFAIKPKKGPRNIKKSDTDITCPKCKKGKIQCLSMDYPDNKGTYHKISFYSCSNRKCRFYAPTHFCKVDIHPNDLKQIIAGKYPLKSFESAKGNKFKAKLEYKHGKITPIFPKRRPQKLFNITCPKCHKGKIGLLSFTSKKGKHIKMYTCSRGCGFSAFTSMAKTKITPTLLKQVLQGKMKPRQFTSKKGKPYTAKFVYKRGKIQMQFVDSKK